MDRDPLIGGDTDMDTAGNDSSAAVSSGGGSSSSTGTIKGGPLIHRAGNLPGEPEDLVDRDGDFPARWGCPRPHCPSHRRGRAPAGGAAGAGSASSAPPPVPPAAPSGLRRLAAAPAPPAMIPRHQALAMRQQQAWMSRAVLAAAGPGGLGAAGLLPAFYHPVGTAHVHHGGQGHRRADVGRGDRGEDSADGPSGRLLRLVEDHMWIRSLDRITTNPEETTRVGIQGRTP